MRLSWNEIRTRAATFAREWAGASYEKGETQSFYNDFFQIFGVKRRTVARYEAYANSIFIILGHLIVRQLTDLERIPYDIPNARNDKFCLFLAKLFEICDRKSVFPLRFIN